MGSTEKPIRYLDVLIVGGGPVGLITAYQLARFGHAASIAIIEKYPKSSQDQYGRAITLYPRSSEMLDQLGLADELAQQCFACRSTVSYDKNGDEVQGRGWYFMEHMKDTQWDFALVLRQKYQEEIFRRRLRELGVSLEAPVELVDVKVVEDAEDGYRITALVKDGITGEIEVIKCHYLVGADGGRSFVRQALEVPFDGSTTEDKWVRIDGVIETDMPKIRVYGAIESPTHGNVLWAALDHGATRIGFAFTAERQKGYPEFNEAAAVAEAIASVKPFTLKFKQIDWYTVYSVGQRVARFFFTKNCVFLAGDACHTHSSGAAQGMNTGMHDSVNLGWKLSLVLRGVASPSLLNTYESERLPNVQKLINYDKDISRLMTMQLPIGWQGDPAADPNEILGVVMEEASTFTSGLSIAFDNNEINVKGSFRSDRDPSLVRPGQRGPDVQLQKPGTNEGTRLHTKTPNIAKFHVVVFAGEPAYTRESLRAISDAVDASKVFSNLGLPISWLTISATSGPSAYEVLGVMPFGRVFYDQKHTAHERYGVDLRKGAIIVLRPDGWIATSTELRAEAVKELERYFEGFLLLT